MSVPVRISEKEYKAAKKAAKTERRSIQGQLEFWAKIGRCAIDNPDLPVRMIVGLLSTDLDNDSDCVPFPFKD